MKSVFRLFVPVLALLVFFGCQKLPESRKVADRFMEHYYVATDLGKALQDADGYAAQKIQDSLTLTGGQPPDKAAHRPSVTFTLTGSTPEAAASPGEGPEGNYLYVVEIKPEQSPPIRKKTLLKLRLRAGQLWKVTQFADYEMEAK